MGYTCTSPESKGYEVERWRPAAGGGCRLWADQLGDGLKISRKFTRALPFGFSQIIDDISSHPCAIEVRQYVAQVDAQICFIVLRIAM